MIPKDIPGLFSARDKEIIHSHKIIETKYGPTGCISSWGFLMAMDPNIPNNIADTIISSGILPQPSKGEKTSRISAIISKISSGILPRYNDEENKPLFVSISSNTGLNERVLAKRLGKQYMVLAGDVADIKRVSSKALPIRFDASFLPFKPGSVGVMLDIAGAIWEESYIGDTLDKRAENVLELFDRLRTSLQTGGLLITDESIINRYLKYSTSTKIDYVLGSSGKEIEGFEVFTIGKDRDRLRVYKKV